MAPAHWLTVTTDPTPTGVDGRACRTRATFFAEVARVLDFPPYFGHNWDALADCLRDAGPIDVVATHAEELLAEESPAQFATMLDIMATAAADGLTLTLQTDQNQKASLHHRVAEALLRE